METKSGIAFDWFARGIPERVGRGILYLDSKFSWWEKAVTLSNLDMGNPKNSLWWMLSVSQDGSPFYQNEFKSIEYGFIAPTWMNEDEQRTYYGKLTEEWIRQIGSRNTKNEDMEEKEGREGDSVAKLLPMP
jgi:hypothetical protein